MRYILNEILKVSIHILRVKVCSKKRFKGFNETFESLGVFLKQSTKYRSIFHNLA